MINPNNANPCSEPGTVYPSNDDDEEEDFAFLNKPLDPEPTRKERLAMERAREERLNPSGKAKYRNEREFFNLQRKRCPDDFEFSPCTQGSSSSFNWGSCLGSLILKIIDFLQLLIKLR